MRDMVGSFPEQELRALARQRGGLAWGRLVSLIASEAQGWGWLRGGEDKSYWPRRQQVNHILLTQENAVASSAEDFVVLIIVISRCTVFTAIQSGSWLAQQELFDRLQQEGAHKCWKSPLQSPSTAWIVLFLIAYWYSAWKQLQTGASGRLKYCSPALAAFSCITSFNLKLVPLKADASNEVVTTRRFLEKPENKMYFSRCVDIFVKWVKLIKIGN